MWEELKEGFFFLRVCPAGKETYLTNHFQGEVSWEVRGLIIHESADWKNHRGRRWCSRVFVWAPPQWEKGWCCHMTKGLSPLLSPLLIHNICVHGLIFLPNKGLSFTSLTAKIFTMKEEDWGCFPLFGPLCTVNLDKWSSLLSVGQDTEADKEEIHENSLLDEKWLEM